MHNQLVLCFLILSSLIHLITCSLTHVEVTSDALWQNYKNIHGKDYTGLEEEIRRETFLQNLEFIQRHNLAADSGLFSFWLSVNRYADQTQEEYMAQRRSLSIDSGPKSNSTYTGFEWDIPDHVDWRHKRIVTDVRDEGSCPSSWAFAAVASIESQHALVTHQLVQLSEQQLIDCSTDFGNDGCHHGSVGRAFKYIELTGGIDGSTSYPYQGMEMICLFDRQHVVSRVTGFVTIHDDELVLKDAVANVGPISVSLNISPPHMRFYDRGIMSNVTCSADDTSHAMTAVGYGRSEDGQDYWLLKNSWGTEWGEDGYLRLARNQNNMCGISSNAAYPLLQTF